MDFGFKSVAHFLSSAWSQVHAGAKKSEAILVTLASHEADVEKATALVLPAGISTPALVIERAAFSALGMLHDAIDSADKAGQAGQLITVTVDADTAQALRNLATSFKSDLQAVGVKVK